MTLVRLALAALTVVLAVAPSHALDRSNIPLKNWGGFSLYRDAVYDDLDRLVTAGLADRAVVNTKPISRVADLCIVHRVRRVPVMKDGRLVGVIARRDVLRALVESPLLACTA